MNRVRPSVPLPGGPRPWGPLCIPTVLLLLLLLPILPAAAAEDQPAPDTRLVMQQPYRICTGDNLEVVYALQANIYRTTTVVRTDGKVTLPFVDDVQAAGLRLDEMSALLREKYSVVYRHPRIDVILRHSVAARAFVGGEVDFAGIISLRQPVTVREALTMAGGPRTSGDISRVVVIRKKSPTDTAFFELDLSDRESSLTEEGMFYLEAGDMVLVPMRKISKLRLWAQQYVYRTLALALTTDFWYYFRWLNFDTYRGF